VNGRGKSTAAYKKSGRCERFFGVGILDRGEPTEEEPVIKVKQTP